MFLFVLNLLRSFCVFKTSVRSFFFYVFFSMLSIKTFFLITIIVITEHGCTYKTRVNVWYVGSGSRILKGCVFGHPKFAFSPVSVYANKAIVKYKWNSAPQIAFHIVFKPVAVSKRPLFSSCGGTTNVPLMFDRRFIYYSFCVFRPGAITRGDRQRCDGLPKV